MTTQKPPLTTRRLIAGGFVRFACWSLDASGTLMPDRPLPKSSGVYAFAQGGTVQYVGVATQSLARHMYGYGRPGVSQRTNLRLNAIIKADLARAPIDIYTISPPDTEAGGLPVHGGAGLGLGIIKKFALPWNIQSVTA